MDDILQKTSYDFLARLENRKIGCVAVCSQYTAPFKR